MNKRHPFLCALCAGIVLAALPVSAATTLHDESTQGDLAQNASAPVFQTSLGTNVVNGTVSYTQTANDLDYFSFVVPQGQAASNLTFSFSNNLLVGNDQVEGNVFVLAGTIPTGLTYLTDIAWLARAEGSIYGTSTPSPVTIDTATLGPGSYTITIEPNGGGSNGGDIPYSLSFDVNSVPEPSVALLGPLAAGLVLIRRRHSA